MADSGFYPRYIGQRLDEALADSPVVLIQGPRQCGKTTLAQMVCAPASLNRRDALKVSRALPPGFLTAETRDYGYISFDDDVARAGAEADPMGFVGDLPEKVILDEVQRVPWLFAALKMEVDRKRVPGRFVLTGSADVLRVPTIQDSLAGRLEVIRLHPLAQVEISGERSGAAASDGSPRFLDSLFGRGFKIQRTERLGRELCERIAAGGYPAALARPPGHRRANWYRNYLDAQTQRDVRDLVRIHTIDALPRLLSLSAAQTANLFNVSELAAPFQISRPTIQDYIVLLERVFLLERLSPWHSRIVSAGWSRLLHRSCIERGTRAVGDRDQGRSDRYRGRLPWPAQAEDRQPLCGRGRATTERCVSATDLAVTVRLGKQELQLLETFVFQELRRQAGWHEDFLARSSATLALAWIGRGSSTIGDRDKTEVDIVIERGTRAVAGIEIKAGATVTAADFAAKRLAIPSSFLARSSE